MFTDEFLLAVVLGGTFTAIIGATVAIGAFFGIGWAGAFVALAFATLALVASSELKRELEGDDGDKR